ncbi:MAG TPA: MFS transporter [Acetobacteraceae bacterium]|jgi:EmrB/QacA subfamily drug resistance transporter
MLLRLHDILFYSSVTRGFLVADSGTAHPRRGLVLAACMIATFTAAVESTIVATALPAIVAELRGAELTSWVFSGYLLTQAVTIPIYGRLADLHGRKRVFIAGSAIFFIGSTFCGLAPGISSLIAFRALQGCGAGCVQPIAYTIIGDIYTPIERARIQGMLSGVFGIAAIAGPTLGALLVAAGTWRFVFWINLPIVGAAIAMVAAFLHEDTTPRRHMIDIAGAFLLIAGIGSVIVGLDRWRQIGRNAALACLAAGIVALLALFRYESRTPAPMLPAALWRSKVIVTGSLGAFAVGGAIMSVIAFLPGYIQAVMGGTTASAGLVLGIMVIVWTFGSIAAGWVMVHVAYRITGYAGALAIIAGALLLTLLAPGSSIASAVLAVSVLGVGLGFCNTTWIVSVQTGVGYRERGSATSAVMFMRFLGQALGAAAGGIVLSFGLQAVLPGVADPVGQLLGQTLDASERMALASAVSRVFHDVFLITALMGVGALALTVRLPSGLNASTSRAGG